MPRPVPQVTAIQACGKMPLQTLQFGLKVAVAEPTRIRIQVRAHLVRANESQNS
jgi:hypothetical protein